MTPCDHTSDYPAHKLLQHPSGQWICPKCGKRCGGCNEVNYMDDLDTEGYCATCAAINARCYDCPRDKKCEDCEMSKNVNKAIGDYPDRGTD